ncbi:MAG: class IV adenylate cyclase [Thermodesulfobacteriota bacterium]
MRTIEIKARCANLDTVRAVLRAHNADFRGTDRQTDTYFRVRHGRLKLREGRIENCLVYYEREDHVGPRQSDVTLVPTVPGSPLKEILAAAFGVLVVVEKRREIYFIDNVKFHLDTVAGLGTFVEIEALDRDGAVGKDQLFAQCQLFLDRFRIAPPDCVAGSYSDLLLSAPRASDSPQATRQTSAEARKTS